jgi:FAD/FMN-containing dehydrogenase/Fe-S oxidoreductase
MNTIPKSSVESSPLANKLRKAVHGEVLFDRFSRGRYATDASIYQIFPVGVVVPKTWDDVAVCLEIATEEGVSILPRGGGTSQSGQTVGQSLVLDMSGHLDQLISFDEESQECVVEPGIVLDSLNARLKSYGLWFPVDVSTASRATIGGMAGNNSCGTRSIRYGIMRDNVASLDALLPDGSNFHFGPLAECNPDNKLVTSLLDIGRREALEIAAKFPTLTRRVGGYNIDALVADGKDINLAELMIGSEATLGLTTRLRLKLAHLPQNKVLGVCHFPNFYGAMDAAQHIVKLGPTAVELVDRTIMDLARDIPLYRQTVESFVRGHPEALLLTEFAQEDQAENLRRLKQLGELMADLGFKGSVVEVIDPALQKSVWDLRKAGLNIVMSMKSQGKPVSFIEDCAVPLEHLAEYTERLTNVFTKHNTTGTWYAHASVGCLHVRPVLNLKLEHDANTMRAIAEEAFDMVKQYKGAHSGEHGDGLVRSEFHQKMYGKQLIQTFNEIKQLFDPNNKFNPGKIVNPPAMNDRSLFRYNAEYAVKGFNAAFDWSEYYGAGAGFQGAVEMCNNNGACRKFDAGVMCPSFRVTRNERDSTRGRANTLRLAISGQLGADAFTSDEMIDTMKLCVSCKGCRRECPTGVDMAKMKIEVLNQRQQKHGLSLQDRLIGYLPHYAPYAARLSGLLNLRDQLPGVAGLSERITGFSARRSLPKWRRNIFSPPAVEGPVEGREVVLFSDTFNRYFEPENLEAARDVLVAAGYRVHHLNAASNQRPLCCGRTFLSVGLVDKAKAEMEHLLAAVKPFIERNIPIIGLEPSCLLSFRDELPGLLPGEDSKAAAGSALMFEEFIAGEIDAGNFALKFRKAKASKALLHGHCHQKSFDVMSSVEKTLALIPGLQVETVPSGCCGMAGAFGYGAATYDTSMAMAELSLLPVVREADEATLLVADGTSCRQQISHGANRQAKHVAVILKDHLNIKGEKF